MKIKRLNYRIFYHNWWKVSRHCSRSKLYRVLGRVLDDIEFMNVCAETLTYSRPCIVIGKKSKTILNFLLMLEKRGFQFLLEEVCGSCAIFLNFVWLMLTLTLKIFWKFRIQWDHAKGSSFDSLALADLFWGVHDTSKICVFHPI